MYDYVIIGNTAKELITLYYLAKNKKKILLINSKYLHLKHL